MSGSDADVSDRIARVTADADVLAADLLIGGAARAAVDVVRDHSWIDLVASDPLLDDAEAVIGALADPDLAGDWRARMEALRVAVDQPAGDHPALASAYRGEAGHLLSFDERLHSAKAGATLRERVETSAKPPDAFVGLFDPADAYEALFNDSYPGPD